VSASSADLHDKIANRFGLTEDLPCADLSLLAPLKRSAEYRGLRPRVADLRPLDHWQEEGLHFFVFPLRHDDPAPANGSGPSGGSATSPEPPVAVFAMHPEERAPVSAVVVTPVAGGEARVLDLRRPESAYTAPYPPPAPSPPVALPLNPTATRTAVTPDGACVTVTGEARGYDVLQWQVAVSADPVPGDESHWRDIPIEVSPTLSLTAGFIESAAAVAGTVTEGVTIQIGSDRFTGAVYEARVRLRAERWDGGRWLAETSPPVIVKRITAAG
jgi:hypothetical protein